jgi:hypothetical protein
MASRFQTQNVLSSATDNNFPLPSTHSHARPYSPNRSPPGVYEPTYLPPLRPTPNKDLAETEAMRKLIPCRGRASHRRALGWSLDEKKLCKQARECGQYTPEELEEGEEMWLAKTEATRSLMPKLSRGCIARLKYVRIGRHKSGLFFAIAVDEQEGEGDSIAVPSQKMIDDVTRRLGAKQGPRWFSLH